MIIDNIEKVKYNEEMQQEDLRSDFDKFTSIVYSDEEVPFIGRLASKEEYRLNLTKGDKSFNQLLDTVSKHCQISIECFEDISKELGHISPNTFRNPTCRNSDDLTIIKYLVIESDTMDLESQKHFINTFGISPTCVIHSGNKSLHAWYRLDFDKMNVDEVKQEIRNNKLSEIYETLGFDKALLNPAQLVRTPSMIRFDKEGNSTPYIQKLLYCNKEAPTSLTTFVKELISWGELNNYQMPIIDKKLVISNYTSIPKIKVDRYGNSTEIINTIPMSSSDFQGHFGKVLLEVENLKIEKCRDTLYLNGHQIKDNSYMEVERVFNEIGIELKFKTSNTFVGTTYKDMIEFISNRLATEKPYIGKLPFQHPTLVNTNIDTSGCMDFEEIKKRLPYLSHFMKFNRYATIEDEKLAWCSVIGCMFHNTFKRPIWSIYSQTAKNDGKSYLVELVSMLFNEFSNDPQYIDIDSKKMNGSSFDSKASISYAVASHKEVPFIIRLDNFSGNQLNDSQELITFPTSKTIQGSAKYQKEQSILNTYSLFITSNGLTLSSDLVDRIYSFKLNNKELGFQYSSAEIERWISENKVNVWEDINEFYKLPKNDLWNVANRLNKDVAVKFLEYDNDVLGRLFTQDEYESFHLARLSSQRDTDYNFSNLCSLYDYVYKRIGNFSEIKMIANESTDIMRHINDDKSSYIDKVAMSNLKNSTLNENIKFIDFKPSHQMKIKGINKRCMIFNFSSDIDKSILLKMNGFDIEIIE